MTTSNVGVTRIAGILLLFIIPLTIAGVVVEPGLESRPEYFHQSWINFVPQRNQFALGNLIMLVTGCVAAVTAVLLFQLFRRRASALVTGAMAALLAGGVLLAIGTLPGLRISRLAGQWMNATEAAANGIEQSALAMEQLRVGLTFLGLPLLLGGLLAWGVIIHRHSPLPRWLKGLPLLSGIIILLSPLGFLDVLNTGFGGFLLISALILFLWLILEGVWLTWRGIPYRHID